MIHISEISTEAPAEKRGALENKVYETLQKLGIAFERVDNDAVDAMEDCVEIGEKLGAEIRKSILLCNRKKTSFFSRCFPPARALKPKGSARKLAGPAFPSRRGEGWRES